MREIFEIRHLRNLTKYLEHARLNDQSDFRYSALYTTEKSTCYKSRGKSFAKDGGRG